MKLSKFMSMPISEFNTPKVACVAYLQGAVMVTERMWPAIRKTHQWKSLSIIFTNDPDADYYGQAWQSSSTIEINLGRKQDFMDTIIHELAHIVQPLMYGTESDERDNPDDLDHPVIWEMCFFDIKEAFNNRYRR